MRKWFQGAVVLCLLAVAPAARAGFILEGSVGKGAKLSPSPVAAEQTNIMIAPGITFLSLLRLQVGFAWDLPDLEGSRHDLEIRPMLTVSPPLLPLYARAIFAVTNLVHEKTTVAVGAALGLSFGVGPIGVFAEAGILPRSRLSRVNWVVEGRLGGYLTF
jgi:hypothetical protein